MADRLDALLGNFSVRATVSHTGNICGIHELPAEGTLGQLHLIKRGTVVVHHAAGKPNTIDTPNLLP